MIAGCMLWRVYLWFNLSYQLSRSYNTGLGTFPPKNIAKLSPAAHEINHRDKWAYTVKVAIKFVAGSVFMRQILTKHVQR